MKVLSEMLIAGHLKKKKSLFYYTDFSNNNAKQNLTTPGITISKIQIWAHLQGRKKASKKAPT